MTTPSGHLRHINLTLGDQETRLRQSLYDSLVRAAGKGEKGTMRRTLDVGAGRGELLQRLERSGDDAYGIDLEPECVTAAGQFGTCRQGNIEDIHRLFPDIQFDVVLCSHVLEHLDSPYASLKTLASLGAEKYVFAVPNLLRPARILRALFGSMGGDHPEHVHAWAYAEFTALLSRCGFHDFQRHTDRVTLNPFHGRLGAKLTRWLEPMETIFAPKFFPMLSSSIIVSCRLKQKVLRNG